MIVIPAKAGIQGPGENRDLVSKMVPGFRRDGVSGHRFSPVRRLFASSSTMIGNNGRK